MCSHKSWFSRRADTTPIGQGLRCHWFLTSCLERPESSLLNLKMIKKNQANISAQELQPLLIKSDGLRKREKQKGSLGDIY